MNEPATPAPAAEVIPTPQTDALRDGFRRGDCFIGNVFEVTAALERSLFAVSRENDLLRGLLANGDKDCVHCGLPAADIAKCARGFPGCGRADDMLCAGDRVGHPPDPKG